MFSRNSDVCILVCDIISPSSIKNLGEWEKRLKDSGCDPPIIVAVNKIDLDPNFEEHFFEMAPKIMEHFPDIMFVSALSGSGIHELFRLAAEKATEYDSRHDPNDRKKKPKTINPANNDGSSEKGCC
ncbi:small GTPase rabi [Tritrichomonas foetus]|uniref:Small GTPase rabi n=1 Tax=Tritrichomonas foetus TaxID=1144522 RepID=A0A1J4JGS5_9EUKA|nr:small GTPase rabi [Tritrichomonas foetus]|eukprot:OHS97495.1 small GTPase rabi [Tritrichomonas foetus]